MLPALPGIVGGVRRVFRARCRSIVRECELDAFEAGSVRRTKEPTDGLRRKTDKVRETHL